MRKSKVKGQRSMSAKIVSYGFPLTTYIVNPPYKHAISLAIAFGDCKTIDNIVTTACIPLSWFVQTLKHYIVILLEGVLTVKYPGPLL